MFHERLVRQVLLAIPMGKWPKGWPWARCSDDISGLGIEPVEQSEIAIDHTVFRVFLWLLPHDTPQRKSEYRNEGKNYNYSHVG